MKRHLCNWVALALLVSVTGQVEADYLFTTIDVPGALESTGFGTQAFGINDARQIVGSYFDPQHGLHASQIGTPFQEVSCERVPQNVR